MVLAVGGDDVDHLLRVAGGDDGLADGLACLVDGLEEVERAVAEGDEGVTRLELHLLDAPGRLSRFQRKHPELAGRIPKKELAAYLNLTPETLSRLKQKYGEP